MTFRSPAEATRAFAAPTRNAVSCVSRVVPFGAGHAPGLTHTLIYPQSPIGAPGRERLELRFSIQYTVDNSRTASRTWSVKLHNYMCIFSSRDGAEILSYHWNPRTSSTAMPHLHLGAGARVGLDVLQRAHLITGPVTVVGMVQLAIEELGVAPLRRDWQRVLSSARTAGRPGPD